MDDEFENWKTRNERAKVKIAKITLPPSLHFNSFHS